MLYDVNFDFVKIVSFDVDLEVLEEEVLFIFEDFDVFEKFFDMF